MLLVGAALHELLEPPGEVLQHLVYLASALEQHPGEAEQIAALAAVEAVYEIPAHEVVHGLLQLGAFTRIRQKTPKGLEGAAGLAVGASTGKTETELNQILQNFFKANYPAEALGVPATPVMVIEDSVSGARAAQAAGIRCLGLAGETPGEALSAAGAEVVPHLDEVWELLER